MSSLTVVGGVYAERCAFPVWDQIYGSGGRAAAALVGHVDQVMLHTALPDGKRADIDVLFDSLGVKLTAVSSSALVGFDYLHCLSDPQIFPSSRAIQSADEFQVDADIAIQFGMMEAAPKVNANVLIYDPQSPTAAKSPSELGSTAERLVIIANQNELLHMCGGQTDSDRVRFLKKEGAEFLIAKEGMSGSVVYSRSGKLGRAPAYQASNVFTIGSGDVFVAAFTLAWAFSKMDVVKAIDFASRAVAWYVETAALPIPFQEQITQSVRKPIALKGGEIYLAAPFRELGQRVLVNEARKIIKSLGMTVFSPVHDVGHGPAHRVVKQDLAALERCDAVFAILNGSSPGTVFEVGYASGLKKEIYCLAQNMRESDLKLPTGVGAKIHTDFVSALHLLAWRD